MSRRAGAAYLHVAPAKGAAGPGVRERARPAPPREGGGGGGGGGGLLRARAHGVCSGAKEHARARARGVSREHCHRDAQRLQLRVEERRGAWVEDVVVRLVGQQRGLTARGGRRVCGRIGRGGRRFFGGGVGAAAALAPAAA